ncbi:MAG: hypothetical protein EOP50_11485 [Sphingobacteriales bacterium]|nr:MAG: hypothetical protein EOP50_11485 [Sphingobacteriales bacterium]
MAGKFVAYREQDQTLLFDTERICYGLKKSAFLQFIEYWPMKYLKSAQLDPNQGSNWGDGAAIWPVYGIALNNWKSPMAFLVGDGSPCGEKLVNGVKTLLFIGASENTKCFVFDLMSDDGPITGMKCFRESDGGLSFNSAQPPLNIIASVRAPNPGPPVVSGSETRYTAYVNGYNFFANPGYHVIKSYVDVPLGGGELAACISFTRSAGCSGDHALGGSRYYSAQEGAFGYIGGVRFMFTIAAAGTDAILGGAPYNYWNRIPLDRFPTALVVRTTGLPFPFN